MNISLCSVLSLKMGFKLQALSDWLKKFHILYATSSDPPLLSEVQRLKAIPNPDQDAAYWPLLHRVAALGWVQETYDLLTSHSVFTTSYTEQQQDPHLKAEVDFSSCARLPLWAASDLRLQHCENDSKDRLWNSQEFLNLKLFWWQWHCRLLANWAECQLPCQ